MSLRFDTIPIEMKFAHRATLMASMVFLLILENSHAQALYAPIYYFSRCYRQITGHSLPSNHSLVNSVNLGTMTPQQACMQTLASADLGVTGQISNSSNMEARGILKNFTDLHRSWFSSDTFSNLGSGEPTQDIIDPSESAYFYSYFLFSPTLNIADLPKLSAGIQALRSNGSSTTNSPFENVAPSSFQNANGTAIGAQFIQTGDLIGFKPINSTNTPLWTRTISSLVSISGLPAPPTPINFNQSFGGGFAGTQSYLLHNFGFVPFRVSDGGLAVPRRWSRSIYKDALCRDLPVIRQADDVPSTLVDGNSPVSFRQSASCVTCHISIDGDNPLKGIGGIVRNLVLHPVKNVSSFDLTVMARYAATSSSDPDYFRQPNTGKFYFRDYLGQRIETNSFSGFSGFGDALSSLDDFYICIAKRYYKYFTNIDVFIGDPQSSYAPSNLTAEQQASRLKVIQLGQGLRTSGRISSLIQDILNSNSWKQGHE